MADSSCESFSIVRKSRCGWLTVSRRRPALILMMIASVLLTVRRICGHSQDPILIGNGFVALFHYCKPFSNGIVL